MIKSYLPIEMKVYIIENENKKHYEIFFYGYSTIIK